MDGDGLLKYWPSMIWGSDVLTSYVLSIAHEAGWEIPADREERMVAGLTGFVQGTVHRSGALETADLQLRKLAALEALSRLEDTKAIPDLVASLTIEPNLWPTSSVLDWWNILKRVEAIQDRDKRFLQADAIIRARLDFRGTTMGFSTDKTDPLWWLMVSVDENAVRAVLSFAEADSWKDDMPRLARGAISRQH